MVVHPPKGEPTVIEYRETAPGAATKDMFKKDEGVYGHRVVGVPGTVPQIWRWLTSISANSPGRT